MEAIKDKERQLSKMTEKKNKIELKRVNMNLPADLVKRVVAYGESKGLNTTSAYIVLLNQALDQKETIDNMPILMELWKNSLATLPENNSVDE